MGGARTNANICDFNISITKSLGVCLLKPNFSSRTNVWYMEVGRERTCWMTIKVKTKTIECEISPVKRAGANRRSHEPVRDQSLGRTS